MINSINWSRRDVIRRKKYSTRIGTLTVTLTLRTAIRHYHTLLWLVMMHDYYQTLVANSSEVEEIWKKQLGFFLGGTEPALCP